MLVVTVEVWPGGDGTRSKVIGTMVLTNQSGLSEIGDYSGVIDGRALRVKDHVRADGAWALVAKVLEADARPVPATPGATT